MPGRRVARELTSPIARRGKPGLIVSDHGTKFTLLAVHDMALPPEQHVGGGRQPNRRRLDASALRRSRSP